MENLKHVQIAEVSSSNDSWRMDLRYETAKIRSLYPQPFSDPLGLQEVLDGNGVKDNKENQGMVLRNVNTARMHSTRKRRNADEKEDNKKSKSSYGKGYERSPQSTECGRHQFEVSIPIASN
ncbi:hypothetical protein B9Z55_007647 [Caenorhabditis nigoni]|uniref:Uncharacterized protein n=1 Tax=Caenorhabditis nigoni TaxID=1611254 RepID=A0A2G5VAM9_9PELO|nr:hypothetical protein B9Z55_007647 [Caenorhabditis nigoni]